MADKDIIVEFKLDELKESLDSLAESKLSELKNGVANAANAGYAHIISRVQNELLSSRQDYLKSLNFEKMGEDSYIIYLDGEWADKLEEGFPGFDMKPGMLSSKAKVSAGSRAGQDWVQTGKSGKKYAQVPIEKKPLSAAGGGSDMRSLLSKVRMTNSQGKQQSLTGTVKDSSGSPAQGKVGVAKNTGLKNADNLVKYQKTYTNADTGKQTTQSIYISFKTVSEESSGWVHPGYEGLSAFKSAEKLIDKTIDDILKHILE